MTLPVSEVFTSFQGEGPRAGRACTFVRLGGCNLSCSWCFDPNTPVLMADWTEKRLGDIQVGELVMSYRNRRYESARVEQTMRRWVEDRVTVVTDDGEVTCTPDHMFANPHNKDGRRRSRADELEGRHVRIVRSNGWAPDTDVRTDGWWTGWAQGLILGDGHVGTGKNPQVWLRLCDRELAEAYAKLARDRGSKASVCPQKRRTTADREVFSVTHYVSRFPEVVGLPSEGDEVCGFLAGFFDAEGHVGRNQITMSQKDPKTLDRVYGMVQSIGIPATLKYGVGGKVGTITINGAANADAFFRLCRPVLDRKTRHQQRIPNRQLRAVMVQQVKEAEPGEVVNLTTSSGFFIAGGMLVENCDSAYTWDASRYNLREELTPTTPEDIARQVLDNGVDEVVITGGEPLMHQRSSSWMALLRLLHQAGIFICVETNGTLVPTSTTATFVRHYSISPKLSNAGSHKPKQSTHVPVWPAGLRYGGQTCLKFVCEDADDVHTAVGQADKLGWQRQNVWVMPQGTDTETLLKKWREICDAAIEEGVNVTQRLHVFAYGDTRGT